MTIEEQVKVAFQALEEKKAEDIRIIDIRGISTIADYFIVASGSNQSQLQAMEDSVGQKMRELGMAQPKVEGNRNSTWILMDYGDFIVHIFSEEDRLFYDLERIWTDGREVEIEDL